MNTAQESPNDRERREPPPGKPEGEQTLQQLAERLRRERDLLFDETLKAIDTAWEEVEKIDDKIAERELGELRHEAEASKEQLTSAIDDLAFEITVVEDEEPAAEPATENQEAELEPAKLAEDMLNRKSGYFVALENLAAMAAKNKDQHREILGVLKGKLGNRAEEILTSPELRKELVEMKARLSQKWGGKDGPPITEDLDLAKLVALRETMGKNPEAFLEVIDLKKRLEAASGTGKMKYTKGTAIRLYDPEVDQKTGELTTLVKVELAFDDSSGDAAIIARLFTREVETDKEGNPRVKKSVHHDLFKLPSRLKANGMAADITRDSLPEYDRQGLNEINLNADIDMGSYAWAAYGYGWDKKEMASHSMAWQKNREMDVRVGGVTKKIKDLSKDEKAAVLKESADYFANEGVIDVIDVGRKNLKEALTEVGSAETESILKEFESLVKNPLTVTPQTLAEFGRKGLKLFQTETTGKWYTEESLEEAVRNKKMTADDAADLRKKPFHAGKIVLLSNSWYGAIDLKNTGEQGGKNRKMLEQYLSKSSAKKP
ncbi:MAG: hypothetical protein AAB692_05930 [Patescibacteria group bacterium]